MGKYNVALVKYDTEKTKNRKRKNMLVQQKNTEAVKLQLEKIHKGDKVKEIFEIEWDEKQNEAEAARLERERNGLQIGVVKRFITIKQYGFITPHGKGKKDLFFHISAVEGGEIKDGDEVEFSVGKGPRGDGAAENIKLLK